jgi:hypothetical protein
MVTSAHGHCIWIRLEELAPAGLKVRPVLQTLRIRHLDSIAPRVMGKAQDETLQRAVHPCFT